MSAIVGLTTVWLTYAADPTDFIRLVTLTDLEEQVEIDARYDLTASGRVRQVRRVGRSTTWKLTLPFNPAAQSAWLREHMGDTICARDSRGNKVFCTYTRLPEALHKHDTTTAATLDLTSITYSEAV